jgi:hypothetical protein
MILSLDRHLRYMHPLFRDSAMGARWRACIKPTREYSRLTDNIFWICGRVRTRFRFPANGGMF